jgi:copper chaperone CopZ
MAIASTYSVSGMHCKSCVSKTETALRAVPGVNSAHVTLNPPQAKIETSRHVSTEELDQAVRAAGEYRLSDAERVAVTQAEVSETKETLYPLFLIVGYIAGTVTIVALATGHGSIQLAMRHFMAGFFLVFSFFKLLDLRGFADTYRTYDILARAWPLWGILYPFVELALGIAYLLNLYPLITNLATLLIMLVGTVGVLKALLDKRAIRCACLGTVLNLPMTKVTLVEDLTMAAMAGAMLTMHAS